MGDRWVRRLEQYDTPMPVKSLLELCEDHRVLIEHHKGVMQYSDTAICVRVKFGTVQILGENLMLGRMTAQQLIIVGKIRCITLERTEKG